MLSTIDLAKIKSKVFAKIDSEIELANKENTIDEFLKKYGRKH